MTAQPCVGVRARADLARTAMLTAVLALLGFVGNLLALPLAGGIDLIFGSIATMLAARLLGVGPTLIVSLLASSQTLVTWNHPYAIIVFASEALVVSLLYRHRGLDTLLADALFWLLIGAPMAVMFYRYAVLVDAADAWLIAGKQTVNALCNTLIANLVWIAFGRRLAPRRPEMHGVAIAPLLFNLLVAFTLIPGLIMVGLQVHESQQRIIAGVERSLHDRVEQLRGRFDYLLGSANQELQAQLAQAVTALSAGGAAGGTAGATAPAVLARITALRPGDGLLVQDPSGRSVSAGSVPAPTTAPTPAMTEAMTPAMTEALPIAARAPLIQSIEDQVLLTAALPTEVGAWRVWASMPLEHLGLLQQGFSAAPPRFVEGLLDSRGACVIGASPPACFQYLDRARGGAFAWHDRGDGLGVLISTSARMPTLARFASSLYLKREPLAPNTPWQLLVGVSASETVASQRGSILRMLGALLLLVVVALAAALWLSQGLMVVVTRLSRVFDDLAPALDAGVDPLRTLAWPRCGVDEIDRLTAHVRGMVETLSRSLAEGRRRSDEMRVLAERLQVANRGAGVGVWDWHVDSGELIFDEQMFEVLGLPTDSHPSYELWRNALLPEDRAQAEAELRRCMAEEETFKIEFRLRHPRRGLRCVLGYAVIFRDQAGRASRLVGLNWDVTEQRMLQAELIQSSKLATLGRMATAMAHELNQPLNVIGMAVGNLNRRLESGRLNDRYLGEKIRIVSAHVRRAAGIIDHMRVFGRKSDGSRQLLNVRQVVRGAMQLAEPQMRGAGVEMWFDCDAGLPAVRGNQVRLEQVLLNLLGNARDALAASPHAEKWVRLRARGQGEHQIAILVEDNAGGMGPDVIEHVFEPFFTTKPPGKGTGLDLSVSYGIIHEMNGTMAVENTVHGARFLIRLPSAEAAPASARRPPE